MPLKTLQGCDELRWRQWPVSVVLRNNYDRKPQTREGAVHVEVQERNPIWSASISQENWIVGRRLLLRNSTNANSSFSSFCHWIMENAVNVPYPKERKLMMTDSSITYSLTTPKFADNVWRVQQKRVKRLRSSTLQFRKHRWQLISRNTNTLASLPAPAWVAVWTWSDCAPSRVRASNTLASLPAPAWMADWTQSGCAPSWVRAFNTLASLPAHAWVAP